MYRMSLVENLGNAGESVKSLHIKSRHTHMDVNLPVCVCNVTHKM